MPPPALKDTLFSMIKNKDTYIFAVIVLLMGVLTLFTITESRSVLYAILSVSGNILLACFAVMGLFEFARRNGLEFLVPNRYLQQGKADQIAQIEKLFHLWFINELEFLKEYEKDRILVFLDQIEMTREEFKNTYFQLIKSRHLPHDTPEARTEKIKEMTRAHNAIVRLADVPGCSFASEYPFFLDFTQLMHHRRTRDILADIMFTFVIEKLTLEGIPLESINRILISHSCNYVFGVLTSRFTKIPKIKVINPQNDYRNLLEIYRFEKHLDSTKAYNVIVIHDVLLTGTQITESIDMLRDHNFNVRGIFCLINREEGGGREKLENLGYRVHSACTLSKEDVETLYRMQNHTQSSTKRHTI